MQEGLLFHHAVSEFVSPKQLAESLFTLISTHFWFRMRQANLFYCHRSDFDSLQLTTT